LFRLNFNKETLLRYIKKISLNNIKKYYYFLSFLLTSVIFSFKVWRAVCTSLINHSPKQPFLRLLAIPTSKNLLQVFIRTWLILFILSLLSLLWFSSNIFVLIFVRRLLPYIFRPSGFVVFLSKWVKNLFEGLRPFFSPPT